MSNLREAAQQALEALRGYRRELGCEQPCDAEQALRAALEQPEQEPVACPHRDEPRGCYRVRCQLGRKCVEPLYLQPPRREWQSLTDQEITDIFEAQPRYHYPPICATDRWFARDIEQALKERNHG
jgi:hypothetical protein